MLENKSPITAFPRILCAGMGSLQLGAVLILINITVFQMNYTHANINLLVKG